MSNIHVFRRDTRWVTHRPGDSADLGSFDTQAEAIESGRAAIKRESGTLVIYGKDGRIMDPGITPPNDDAEHQS
jgi:hypothetical protein